MWYHGDDYMVYHPYHSNVYAFGNSPWIYRIGIAVTTIRYFVSDLQLNDIQGLSLLKTNSQGKC